MVKVPNHLVFTCPGQDGIIQLQPITVAAVAADLAAVLVIGEKILGAEDHRMAIVILAGIMVEVELDLELLKVVVMEVLELLG
jgi:hypothetical protein